MDEKLKRALGSIVGAFLGDALGSYIEFISPDRINEIIMRTTLSMPGGGTFNTSPGQVTDDSELAMCILRGLTENPGVFDLENIAKYYKLWIKTGPFDVGMTVGRALNALGTAKNAIETSESLNKMSCSNGSLMRCTPLAVFCRNLSEEDLIKAVTLDCSITHSSLLVKQAEVCYVAAIVHLINNPGDSEGAYDVARRIAFAKGCRQLQNWFDDIENSAPMAGTPQAGFVKIAFDHSFRHLKKNSSFETAMHETLRLGGDTDTNACIVGGMIGALVGVDNLRNDWKEKVLNFEGKGTRLQRPDFLNQKEVEGQVIQLFDSAPQELNIRLEN